jgi:saccharopine dehydrogenase-like NADP-dependent oxidoreductase
MTARVLIIGGYGNFGSYIARNLAQDANIQLVIGGRSQAKAEQFSAALQAVNSMESHGLDIEANLDQALRRIMPDIVIHTSGPFQGQDYRVAEACIRLGCHYLDLADARSFVAGIAHLDDAAKAAKVLVVGGASSVPALTSAIIDRYRGDFGELIGVEYAIATAQRTNTGLATTAAVLSYAGKPFETLVDGRMTEVYGWQDLQLRRFEGLGWRLLGNCDVPDLELFPRRYPELKTIRFYAGLEVHLVHLGLWLLTWPVRFGLLRSLRPAAPLLLKLSRLFDFLGSDNSGFYMRLSGKADDGAEQTLTFSMTARQADGPNIPCMPAVLIAKALARGALPVRGAMPCMGLIDLESYLAWLEDRNIDWSVSR